MALYITIDHSQQKPNQIKFFEDSTSSTFIINLNIFPWVQLIQDIPNGIITLRNPSITYKIIAADVAQIDTTMYTNPSVATVYAALIVLFKERVILSEEEIIALISAGTAGVSSFNGRTGAVTLTNTDVNTALGYVPFPTPNGTVLEYITGTGSLAIFPTKLSDFTNDPGFITASSTNNLTNKSGLISQWTNDVGYLTSATFPGWQQGGNSFGTLGILGTLDGYELSLVSNSTPSLMLDGVTKTATFWSSEAANSNNSSLKVNGKAIIGSAVDNGYRLQVNGAMTLAPITLPTIPVNYALETDGTHLYFTLGGIRLQLDDQGAEALTIGTIDSVPKSPDGIVLDADVLYMQSADATYPGLVNTTTQTWAGNKTLNGQFTTIADLDLVHRRATSSNALFGISLQTSAGQERAFFKMNQSSGEIRIGAGGNSYFPTFYSNGVEIFRITTTGEISIGATTSPSKVTLTASGLGAYQTTSAQTAAGLMLTTITAATDTVQQNGAPLTLRSNAWNTTTSASQPIDWRLVNFAIPGATPSSSLRLQFGVNNGAFTEPFLFSSIGQFNAVGNIVTNASFILNLKMIVTSPAEGIIALRNFSSVDFGRLQFGDGTSAFPALKRSGNSIHVRLADDSGFAPLHTGELYTHNNIWSNTRTITTSTTIDKTYSTVLIDASSGNIVVTLPSAASSFDSDFSLEFEFLRVDNTANTVTISAAPGDTINGSTSITIVSQYSTIRVKSNGGTTWYKTDSGTGSISIGTIDSIAKSANGAVFLNDELYMQSADTTYPGLITTGSQALAGDKTLNGQFINVADADLVHRRATASNALFGISLQNNIGQDRGVFKLNLATGEIRIGAVSSTYFTTLYSNNVEVVRITTTGEFSIGATTAPSKLTVTASNLGVYQLTTAQNAAGFMLTTATAAVAGTQQVGPPLVLRSNVWNTTTSTSQTFDWRFVNFASQGATPTSSLRLQSSLNGAVYTEPFLFNSTGQFNASANIIAGGGFTATSGGITINAGNSFIWNTRSIMSSHTDGVIIFRNQALNDFNSLQFGGTTAPFPALVKVVGGLRVRYADNTGDASLSTGDLFPYNNIWQNIRTITASTTIDKTYSTILVNATSGNVVLTLPSAATSFNTQFGISFTIVRIDNTANTVTISAAPGDSIDGGVSVTIPEQYASVTVQSSGGTTWYQTTSVATASVLTIGALDSVTKSPNGATLIADTLYLQSADATFPGLVNNSAQTFTGAKTFSNNVSINANVIISSANFLMWTLRSRMYSSADGVISMVNNAVNDFNRLTFGGTTSAFPSIKRSGTNLIIRLADDSGNSDLEVASEAYGPTWSGSAEVPTKGDLYLKLESGVFGFTDGNGFDGTITGSNLSLTTQLTEGSVPFIGTGGALLQDNANFFWNNTTKKLGIGPNASAPIGQIHSIIPEANGAYAAVLEKTTAATNAISSAAAICLTSTGNMADGFGPGLAFQIKDNAGAYNTAGVIGAVRGGTDNTGDLVFGPVLSAAYIERMRIKSNGNVGIGTDAPTAILHTVANGVLAGLFDRVVSTSNVATSVISVKLTTALAATDGFGPMISFQMLDSGGVNRLLGLIGNVKNGASNAADFIFSPAINGVTTEVMRITSTGFVGIDTAAPIGELHIVSTSTTSSDRGFTSAQHSNSTSPAIIRFRKSRGTEAVPVIVATGDVIGTLAFNGYGTSYLDRARIAATVNGAVATNDVPTDLVFYTSVTTTVVERMRILSTGNIGIGTTSPFGVLHISAATNALIYATNTSVLSTTSGAGINLYNIGTPGAADQRLGFILFGVNTTGTTYRNSAAISAITSGAWTDNTSQPTDLIFETTATFAATRVERLRITSAGQLINTTDSDIILRRIANTTALYGLSIQGTPNLELGGIKANVTSGEIRIGAFRTTYFPTFYSHNLEVFRITTTGGIVIGATTGPSKLSLVATNLGAYTTTTTQNAAGFMLSTATAATSAAATQNGAPLILRSNAWSFDLSASQTVDFRFVNVATAPGSGSVFGTLRLQASINGAAYTDPLTINSSGNLTVTGHTYTGGGSVFGFTNRSIISSPVNGNLMLRNNAGSDFNMLIFGGLTSAFPALKRSSTNLVVRLSDDSGNTHLEVADEAYGPSWSGSLTVPTKNALYTQLGNYMALSGDQTIAGNKTFTNEIIVTRGSGVTPDTNSLIYMGRNEPGNFYPLFIMEDKTDDGYAHFGVWGQNRKWNLGVGNGPSNFFDVPNRFFILDAVSNNVNFVIDPNRLIGISGITNPTAFLHIPANSATYAALRIEQSATDPSSPNAGDIWNNSGLLKFRAGSNNIVLNNATSGTYTPTTSGATNIDASTTYTCQYLKVDNIVTVSGKIDIDFTTTSTQFSIELTLPISSSFTANEEAGGTGASPTGTRGYSIYAKPSDTKVVLSGVAESASNTSINFHFTYQIK